MSKRRFTVHPRVHVALGGSAVTITSVGVKLGSKTIARTAKPNALAVDLRGVRKGTFTLTITAKTSDGPTLTGKATYHTCISKRSGKKQPPLSLRTAAKVLAGARLAWEATVLCAGLPRG